MRAKENLMKFNDMKILYQYLYLSEDNFIDVKNSIGVTLRLRMNDNMAILCQNMNFPDFPQSNWSDQMIINTVFDIVDQLKEVPAIEFPEKFSNRWEEIKTICNLQMSLNRYTKKRPFKVSLFY